MSAALGMHTARRMLLEAVVLNAHEVAAVGFMAPPVPAAQLPQLVQRTTQRIASLAPGCALEQADPAQPGVW